jgi:hypothetical protein
MGITLPVNSISSAQVPPPSTQIHPESHLCSWLCPATNGQHSFTARIKLSSPRRSSGWRQGRGAGTSRGLCGRRCCRRRRPASLRRSCLLGRLGCRCTALCWRWGRGCEEEGGVSDRLEHGSGSALTTGVQCIMIPGLGDLLVLSSLVGHRDNAPADDVVPGALQVAGDVVLVFGGRCSRSVIVQS